MTPYSRFTIQRGFTLVELMIALIIGLIITLGASQLFIMSKRSFDRSEELAARQETMRFLVDTLSLDIRTADSGGMIVSGDNDQVLTLVYSGSREDDPYCASGEDLNRLVYSFDEDEQTLSIETFCDNVSKGSEPLVSELEEVSFPAGGGSSSFVGVLLRFIALDQEPASSREVEFTVANRSTVIARINE